MFFCSCGYKPSINDFGSHEMSLVMVLTCHSDIPNMLLSNCTTEHSETEFQHTGYFSTVKK